MACLRNLAIGVLIGLGRSTSLLPYAATPATLPGPLPPSGSSPDETDITRERRNLAKTGGTDLALTVAGRLWRFWQLRGHYAEGHRWLEDLLAAETSAGAPRVKA